MNARRRDGGLQNKPTSAIDMMNHKWYNTTRHAMKEVIETDECREFRALLTDEESAEYRRIRFMLNRDGRLEYPYGEKVEDETNLFAIRIRKGGNARFFYAYDDGTAVWILNGYEKKTERIPKQELKRARQLKRKYEL